MPGYTTRLLTIRLGGHDFRIRALSDLQQFADPTGSAHRAGISSSLWSLFGQIWPSGRVLAEAMSRFDLIIGSDILYERDHALQIAAMMLRHARPDAELLITDPGRGNSGPFTRAMAAQGYTVTEQRSRFDEKDVAPFRGRLLSYQRDTSIPVLKEPVH